LIGVWITATNLLPDTLAQKAHAVLLVDAEALGFILLSAVCLHYSIGDGFAATAPSLVMFIIAILFGVLHVYASPPWDKLPEETSDLVCISSAIVPIPFVVMNLIAKVCGAKVEDLRHKIGTWNKMMHSQGDSSYASVALESRGGELQADFE